MAQQTKSEIMTPTYMSEIQRYSLKNLKCLSILIALNLIFTPSAHAYVDPGSGSIIVTTILGFIAAIGYTFRKYFYKTKRFFTKKNISEDKQKPHNNDE